MTEHLIRRAASAAWLLPPSEIVQKFETQGTDPGAAFLAEAAGRLLHKYRHEPST